MNVSVLQLVLNIFQFSPLRLIYQLDHVPDVMQCIVHIRRILIFQNVQRHPEMLCDHWPQFSNGMRMIILSFQLGDVGGQRIQLSGRNLVRRVDGHTSRRGTHLAAHRCFTMPREGRGEIGTFTILAMADGAIVFQENLTTSFNECALFLGQFGRRFMVIIIVCIIRYYSWRRITILCTDIGDLCCSNHRQEKQYRHTNHQSHGQPS